MSTIKVAPCRRPRLSKAGLMTVMSPSGRGLACVASTCPTPGCECRDIFINVIPIDFRVQTVSVNGDKVRFASLPIGGLGPAEDKESAVIARLITDTGELLVDRAHPADREPSVDPRADALLQPLREALDGELLDDFARFCMRCKGEQMNFDDPIHAVNLGDWLPGDKLGFAEVYDSPRIDSYRERDTIWEAADFYCPDPRCDCHEVLVAFLERDGNGDAAGSVRLDLSTGEVIFEHETADKTLVPGLWRRFIERHRGLSFVRSRFAKMKTFGKTLAGPHRKVEPSEKTIKPVRYERPRVGRNDPCSCGSGKKYKKCCLPRSPEEL